MRGGALSFLPADALYAPSECFGGLGAAGFIDVMVSRIVLDERDSRDQPGARPPVSRGDFESAKVDGGAVCLKRRDGGWLVPDTGRNTLAVRNTIHAWIKSSES